MLGVSKVCAVAFNSITEDVSFPDVGVEGVYGVQFIRGFKLVLVARTNPAVAKAIVAEDALELIVSSSVHFSDSEELVVDVALVLRSDFVIGLALPEDVFLT